MKISIKRIIIWFAFLGCLIAAFSVSHSMDVESVYGAKAAQVMTSSDAILLKISSAIFWIAIAFGLFVELDYGGLKEKLPFFKDKTRSKHIIAWILVIAIGYGASLGIHRLTSSSFQKAEAEYTQEQVKKAKNS